jgi:hypothetical protein
MRYGAMQQTQCYMRNRNCVLSGTCADWTLRTGQSEKRAGNPGRVGISIRGGEQRMSFSRKTLVAAAGFGTAGVSGCAC